MKLALGIIAIILMSGTLLLAKPELMGSGSLSGFVKDSETEETLIGATVFIKGTKLGAYTNKSGFFSITGIEPGEYEVSVTSVGFEKLIEKINITKDKGIRKTFMLKQNTVMKEGITVDAEKEVEKREISISKIKVPIKQIKQIRTAGEADVFRSLQYLPGVLTSSQISSGLYIRGGSPDQNLILLDGSVVYNPSHLFGFISTFNPEAVKDVELIKGGFPAEYGGRLSSVLTITQKDGDRSGIHGLGSIGAISSRLSLEGPIGNGSWFVGGRRTYFEAIKALLDDDPTEPLPDYSFWDVNGKISQNFGRDDKIFFSGMMTEDFLDYSSFGLSVGLGIENKAGSVKWTHIFGDNLFSTLNLSGSTYSNGFVGGQSGFTFDVSNSITDYTLKGSLEWFTTDKITHKFGFESSRYRFNFYQNIGSDSDTTTQTESNGGGQLNLDIYDWNHSFYGQINDQLTDLMSMQLGIRVNYWENSDLLTFDPRIAFRYQFQENVAVKASWGIYHQNLRLASQQDFSFFDTWLPTDSTLPASRAYHYILSFETEPTEGYDLNFDFYYKNLNNMSELNNLILEANTARDVFFIGDAEAYGGEVFLQKRYGNFNGWIGYALGFIYANFDSINNGETFRPKYDRRHDLKIVANYMLNDNWEFGASFTFQSGQSYTGQTSRFQTYLPGSNLGKGITVPSQRYGLRLPASHQLNVNVAYSFKMFKLPAKLILDIFNIYNRRDIWFRYYDTTQEETEVKDIKLLPIVPSVSFEIKF